MRSVLSVCAAVLLAAGLAGCSGSRPNKVILPPLSAVTLSITADTLGLGSIAQLSATAFDLSSQPVGGASFAWSSTNTAIATVNSTGRVTATGEGAAWVIAEAGGLRDSAEILVVPASAGWNTQTSNSSRQLNAVFFQPDGRTGCVVGNLGEILTTSDAGATWVRRTSGTIFHLNAVWFVSATEGWAVGGNGTALRTTNGGIDWALVPTGSSDNLTDVYFAAPDTGWAVGSNGVVLRTFDPDAPSPWVKQYPTASQLNGVRFAGTRDGWAVGNGGTILGSHDRGLTWFTVSPAVTALSLNAVARRSEPLAFAVGAGGAAPRTFAGPDSTSWQLGSAGAANNLEDLSFATHTRGWAVGSNGSGVLLATADGGATWSPQTAPSLGTLRGVYFIDTLRGWAVGDNGAILHTGSGGN